MKIKHISFLFYLLALSFQSFCGNENEITLNRGWQFRQLGKNEWYQARVPGCVHTDLLDNKLIKDPFFRTNEGELQWIDKVDWEYKTRFDVPKKILNKSNIVLNFDGLDTYADVYLNDQKILQADNMFRRWQADVKSLLKAEGNELRIYFHSPIQKGLELMEASPYPYPANNDQAERGGLGNNVVSVFTRKAGYHYGWDWGPRFVTSGIRRPVALKAWDTVQMKDVFIRQLKVTAQKAELEVVVLLEGKNVPEDTIVLKNAKTGDILFQKKIESFNGTNEIRIPFTIENPELWWSNGLGEQTIYEFKAELS